MRIRDSRTSYGAVSKALHWGVAALLVWQFGGMLSKITLGKDSALTGFLAANHAQVGTVVFLLIAVRIVWALLNRANRPPRRQGLMGDVARLGHFTLYVLALLSPTAALIRAWGGARAFAPFGFEIFSARSPDQVITAATDIGANFHGELAWILGVLILGHVLMATVHHVVFGDDTLKRMVA